MNSKLYSLKSIEKSLFSASTVLNESIYIGGDDGIHSKNLEIWNLEQANSNIHYNALPRDITDSCMVTFQVHFTAGYS